MSEVEKFPGRFHHRRHISPAQIYAAPEPSDKVVWDVCAYQRMASGRDDDWRCEECPAWEHDEVAARYSDDGSDLVKRGCRAIAEEICRIVLAGHSPAPPVAPSPPQGEP